MMRPLSEDLYSAATQLWHESGYDWVIDAIVMLYVSRPIEPNSIPHPMPKAQFAIDYMGGFDLSSEQKEVLCFAVQTGGDNDGAALFGDQSGLAYEMEDPKQELFNLCYRIAQSRMEQT